jgi:hypothetical protein
MEDIQKIFDNLKIDIIKGIPYSVLKKKYPLMTTALYKKLSGINKIFRYDLDNDTIKILTSDGLSKGTDYEAFSAEAKSYIIGSLFGDGHVEPITENNYTNTFIYRVTHCWSQIGYIKYAYECLKPYSSAISIKKPGKKGLQDYHIQLTTIATKRLKEFRELFYPEENYFKKDVMSEKVYSLLNWQSLAYWVMDDGKHRGAKYCFSICIGFQNHYTDERIEKMTSYLSGIFGIDFLWKKEKINYEIYVLRKDTSRLRKYLLPYILPEFYYKFDASPSELGAYYRNKGWFSRWQDSKLSIQHPYLENISYSDYKQSQDNALRKRYELSLFSRTVARGFPYIRLSEEGLKRAWDSIAMYSTRCTEDNVLTCSPRVNAFPNHFMNHRYHCKKRNNNSPYSVYLDRKKLRKTLEIQLRSGPNIESTNIRNALSTYSSSGLGVFNTGIARYLIDKYSINNEVLDPCSGWGNRLCAAASLGKNYTGIEPSKRTFNALMEIKKKISELGVSSSITINNSVAEDSSNFISNHYGCCITSPPYFNLEEYSEESNQSYIRYPNYREWVDCFLKAMVINVYEALLIKGYFIINVGNVKGFDLVGSTQELCESTGFALIKTYSLRSFKRPGMKCAWNEPVLVYEKV